MSIIWSLLVSLWLLILPAVKYPLSLTPIVPPRVSQAEIHLRCGQVGHVMLLRDAPQECSIAYLEANITRLERGLKRFQRDLDQRQRRQRHR